MVNISFDIDGVLANFETPAIAAMRELFGIEFPEGYEMQRWSFAERITSAQWSQVFDHLLKVEDLWSALPAYDEGVRALKQHVEIYGESHVYYTTARPPCAGGSTDVMTQLWFHTLGLPMGNLAVVRNAEEKKNRMLKDGIVFSIDDHPSNVEACNCPPFHEARLLDRPYNREAAHLPRVYSVAEFLLEIELA